MIEKVGKFVVLALDGPLPEPLPGGTVKALGIELFVLVRGEEDVLGSGSGPSSASTTNLPTY